MPEENTAPPVSADSTPAQNDLNTGSDQNTNDDGKKAAAPVRDFKDEIIAQKSFENRETKRKLSEVTGKLQELETVVKNLGPNAAPDNATLKTPAAPTVTQQEIEAKAEEIANAKLAERDFNRACNDVAEKGLKAYPDFGEAYSRAFIVGGDSPPTDFLQTVVKLKNPHQVLYTLAQDPAEAHRIMSLPRDERTVELVRLETKAAEAKPKVSNATPPIKPVDGKRPSGAVDLLDENVSTAEWMAKRSEEKRARFEQSNARRRA